LYAATPAVGSEGLKFLVGPCHGPAGEHAQYEVTVVSPAVPAAIVNSTYVPPTRTTENALPTFAPLTGRGRTPHREPSQYRQAAASPSRPSGTRATYADEAGREAACPSSPPKTYVQPPFSTSVVPNRIRRDGSGTRLWSSTFTTDSTRRAGRDSVATSVAVGTP